MPGHKARKDDHIRISLEEDVQSAAPTTGLERYHLLHQALPELDLEAVDLGTTLFGRRLRAPLLISAMTGGTSGFGDINLRLAHVAQARGIAMALGSQRVALEHPEEAASFQVRAVAPDILLFANLGAVQLNYGYDVEHCRRAVEMAQADALILHLNPLHEALQPEGNRNWAGLLSKIERVCQALEVPVVAKEVGWGISAPVARALLQAGVAAIDVAGAGGTSWSKVESHRAAGRPQRRLAEAFAGWGIPTALALQWVREAVGERMAVFASGGIRSGVEAAKCLALGADLVGLAAPLLRAAVQGVEAALEEVDLLLATMQVAMFAAGAGSLAALREPGRLYREDEPVARADGIIAQRDTEGHGGKGTLNPCPPAR